VRPTDPPTPVTVGPARAPEITAALRLVFGHLPDVALLDRVRIGLDLIAAGELDPAGLLVARGPGGEPLGAVLCQALPGAGGQLWPPGVSAAARDPAAVADALLGHAAAWLRGRGARFAQAFIPEGDEALAGPLPRHGFAFVTDLWSLRLDLAGLPTAPAPPGFTVEDYAGGDRDAFHRVLLDSYRDSRDVPEMAGLRSLPEILAGMQAEGFDPARWWLARLAGRPAGVLVLHVAGDTWEVAYLGVAPAERRRGCGRGLLALAVREARVAGTARLEIQVDDRNEPARALYRAAGFRPYERRKVYLAVWRE
jgi:ribosomal protein S18 acetylase RimI-like enzyme